MPIHEPEHIALKVIGMSAPANLWASRFDQVRADGVTARRNFATGAASGQYDAMMDAVGSYLESKGAIIAATYWHEPHGDMTAAVFREGSRRFVERVKSPLVKVGPILNGWLLDNQVALFDGYTDAALLDAWDWFGMDTYQSGSPLAPGAKWPGHRVPLLANFLASKGKATMPVGIGEYNGFTAASVTHAGEAFLSMSQLWFACVWNSTGGTFEPLAGARLRAFRATKGDDRVEQ